MIFFKNLNFCWVKKFYFSLFLRIWTCLQSSLSILHFSLWISPPSPNTLPFQSVFLSFDHPPCLFTAAYESFLFSFGMKLYVSHYVQIFFFHKKVKVGGKNEIYP